jgi:hypothetical protein
MNEEIVKISTAALAAVDGMRAKAPAYQLSDVGQWAGGEYTASVRLCLAEAEVAVAALQGGYGTKEAAVAGLLRAVRSAAVGARWSPRAEVAAERAATKLYVCASSLARTMDSETYFVSEEVRKRLQTQAHEDAGKAFDEGVVALIEMCDRITRGVILDLDGEVGMTFL